VSVEVWHRQQPKGIQDPRADTQQGLVEDFELKRAVLSWPLTSVWMTSRSAFSDGPPAPPALPELPKLKAMTVAKYPPLGRGLESHKPGVRTIGGVDARGRKSLIRRAEDGCSVGNCKMKRDNEGKMVVSNSCNSSSSEKC
jgi:hypothetical protein